MKKVLFILLILVPAIAQAEWAASYGLDARHDMGREYAEVRYLDLSTPFFHGTDYAFGWSAYAGTDNTHGADIFYPYKNWEFGWGVEYSDYQEDLVETTWKYELRIGYNFTKHISAQLLHKSNCKGICGNVPGLSILPHGGEDVSNKGLNYLSLMVRY